MVLTLCLNNSGSLKQSAQENSGTGIRKKVAAHGELPKLVKRPQIGIAYIVIQTVRRHGVYSAAYGTMHYKEQY